MLLRMSAKKLESLSASGSFNQLRVVADERENVVDGPTVLFCEGKERVVLGRLNLEPVGEFLRRTGRIFERGA